MTHEIISSTVQEYQLGSCRVVLARTTTRELVAASIYAHGWSARTGWTIPEHVVWRPCSRRTARHIREHGRFLCRGWAATWREDRERLIAEYTRRAMAA